MTQTLFYLANIRLPTEKAHGLQIVQNCEAFADCGLAVTLFAARRVNTPEMQAIPDMYSHYGVKRTFGVRRVPCLDLFPVLERFSARLTFALQVATYTFALCIWMLLRRADVYYSRDLYTLLALSLFKPRRSLVYEVHQLSRTGLGRRLQTWCVQRVGLVAAVTGPLGEALRGLGAHRVIQVPDGFQESRFADLPKRHAARQQTGLPESAFIAGYMGRLHTMQRSKGVDTLVNALARADRPIHLCLVGGPDDMAEALRVQWIGLGLPADRFHYAGQIAPGQVPVWLAAFDVSTMPFPFTEHFAYYASPLKLFEYMAAGGVILASDLPSTAEIVQDGQTAILYPPGDESALAEALRRLYDDPALRQTLSQAARAGSVQYSWAGRAERILRALKEG